MRRKCHEGPLGGFAVPFEALRVLKQAALACAAEYFEGDSKEGLALLTAMLQKFSISQDVKYRAALMLAEMLRACVTRGINISSEELGI